MKLNFSLILQRILDMYIVVEPYLYDTSQVKYISSVLVHSNVYVLPCLFGRNCQYLLRERRLLSARNFKIDRKFILPSVIRGFKSPRIAGLVAGIWCWCNHVGTEQMQYSVSGTSWMYCFSNVVHSHWRLLVTVFVTVTNEILFWTGKLCNKSESC